ncbi:MAG: rod shape-determining protein MreC [Tenuifilaceae bacterium]|jgi:rod shape-determining protein MreC|uniref:rod shape-determining protein MreC n=1 Tax=Perlabentimonas gracilis TaxID=2715279 RepID=UPI00140B5D38|nr:rod shape-determining protein MreC [Perlabentimonas gracilis]MDX9769738.1 rod shape-determining protein MreC [Tenuifilaceae bacterium]NHB68389.1 rod shape-determining protein MreC [Perlabentimonas gracilis]
MNSLIRFIVRYQFFLLFLVLETFSFWLLSTHSYYQSTKLEDATRTLTGFASTRISNATKYLKLAETNEHLAQSNLELRNQLAALNTRYDLLRNKLGDTLVEPNYSYTLAKVVNNSINKQYNYLTLNVGKDHGVKKEMGVVSSQGVIGIVAGVSSNYSTVISLLNVDLKISAKLKRTNHFGSLYWDGKNYREVLLTDVPQHVAVSIGDTVVTSGYSAIFPADINLGTISSVEGKGSNFHNLKVKLFADFKQLSSVWVVSPKLESEREDLENTTTLR